MVSLRRRRNLGFPSGLPRASEQPPVPRDDSTNVKKINQEDIIVDPLSLISTIGYKQEQVSTTTSEAELGSSSSKEEPVQQYPVPEVKKRKRHRRKHTEDREQCIMRGVYFKNTKWQAAIKVEKKQIHLGTVASQEEAARLYDRRALLQPKAAFLCGREPNFELPEEEKQELLRFKWEEFLAKTRDDINRKKNQRKIHAATRRNYKVSSEDWDDKDNANRASSACDDVDGGDVSF